MDANVRIAWRVFLSALAEYKDIAGSTSRGSVQEGDILIILLILAYADSRNSTSCLYDTVLTSLHYLSSLVEVDVESLLRPPVNEILTIKLPKAHHFDTPV